MTTSGGWTASSPEDDSPEDELLSQLYQQLTERQAAGFAAGYDIGAGLDRYRAWLGEHAAREPSRPEAIPLQGSTPVRAAFADSSAGIAAAVIGGPVVLRRTTQGSAGTGGVIAAGWDAEQAVTALYSAHYRSLVRLAVLLVRDVATAEQIVQDSFMGLHGAWPRLGDGEKALSYLRKSVVMRSRSVLRHRVVADQNAPKPAAEMPSAEQGALTRLERSAVVVALRALPSRQREALVLRYYGGLSEAQIASAMGISRGAVRSHTAKAIAALRAVLEM
jgi:RNA polymerase sigma-70 factor (sigma-E family)